MTALGEAFYSTPAVKTVINYIGKTAAIGASSARGWQPSTHFVKIWDGLCLALRLPLFDAIVFACKTGECCF